MRPNRWPWVPLSAALLAVTGCWAQGEPVAGAGPEPAGPLDDQVVRSEVLPPPITGGTLIVVGEGNTAVASDPDRDLVHVVDLVHAEVLHTIELPAGDQPGRLVADARGLVHVVARRGGAVIDLDPGSGELLGHRSVCPNPRGLAYEAEIDALHVACAGGELVTLPATTGGPPTRRVMVAPDLRDVFFTPDGLFVSRFRTAELLQIDDEGAVVDRVGLPVLERGSRDQNGSFELMKPNSAWRTVPAPRGDWLMLHQVSTTRSIPTAPPEDDDDDHDGTTTFGDDGGGVSGGDEGFASATGAFGDDGGDGGGGYGGSPVSCDAVVHPVLTLGNGTLDTKHSAAMLQTVLPVDVAVSRSRLVAMAVAGAHSAIVGTGGVVTMDLDEFEDTTKTGCIAPRKLPLGEGQFVAVAYDWTERVVAQSREPARIVCMDPAGNRPTIIDLPGAPRRDTGHDLFHLDAGGGIACATCHAEGGDDGHVWRFDDLGARHTPALAIGLAGTEPFHWQGDLADMSALAHEVHEGRMGGKPLSRAHVDALQSWMFAMSPPNPLRTPTDDAVVRGEALFTTWGCGGCHTGLALASNQGVDIGVGFDVQVPGLHGVALHPPYMHDGRAADLREAVVDMLARTRAGMPTSEEDVGDLVAYLESL